MKKTYETPKVMSGDVVTSTRNFVSGSLEGGIPLGVAGGVGFAL